MIPLPSTLRRWTVTLLAALAVVTAAPAQNVTAADSTAIRRLIGERNGRLLVLNVWATWCLPCREEFPALNRLHRYGRTNGVDVVALSVDYPDEVRTKIMPFLKSVRAEMPVMVADVEPQDRLFAMFDPAWSGAIPMTFVYDTAGTLRRSLLGKRTFEQFRAAVDSLR